ncbi:3610_t:CDS:2, partial [Rhizophagus irregularis]
LQDSNNDYNSPYLIDCKGCAFNIRRKTNKEKCMIYIEKETALLIKGRVVKDKNDITLMKPYMTRENIYEKNEMVVKENIEEIEGSVKIKEFVTGKMRQRGDFTG